MSQNAGRLMSKAALMEALWPNVVVTADSLMQCVTELRSALGAANASLIENAPRRGYLLDAVLSVPEPDPAAAAATSAPAGALTPASAVAPVSPVTNANSASASPLAATPTKSHSPPFRSNLRLILASAVVLVVCALAWQRWHSPKLARVDHAMAARKSTAVLPLTDLSDKPSPWFAEAVTRDLRSWCILAAPMRLNSTA